VARIDPEVLAADWAQALKYQLPRRCSSGRALLTPHAEDGNLLLYVYEVQRGFGPGEGIKAFKVAEVGEVEVTDGPFQPRYPVE
jgi:hypothetical protein